MEAVAENGHAMSVTETAKLENLETVIDGGLKSFIEVGRALMEIRDGRLFRATHMKFEDYCQERWDMTSQYANRLVAAADVVDGLPETIVSKPINEAQVRPLTRLPEEDRASAWKEAIEIAPNGKPTAAIVEEVVASRLPEDESESESDQQRKGGRESAKDMIEREAAEVTAWFHETVKKVSDGTVYTTELLSKVTGSDKTRVQWFVRMCDVSPTVKVHRNAGRKGLIQYTFEKTNVATGHARIRQLAKQIADDHRAGAKAQSAAQKILSLLGG
jgi:hypothetical protein